MAKEQNRPDIHERRMAWLAQREQWEAGRLIFIDESCAKTNMTRLRGRTRKGKRLREYIPHGHWNTTTMIGAVRLDGTVGCMAIDGSTTREVYREFVRQVLCPLLRPGDIVIADNLSAHKDTLCTQLIAQRGAEYVFLPPYSPDLNPIENMWSKTKQHLRKAKARTHEALYQAIGEALQTITSQDAKGFFSSCGYTTSQS